MRPTIECPICFTELTWTPDWLIIYGLKANQDLCLLRCHDCDYQITLDPLPSEHDFQDL